MKKPAILIVHNTYFQLGGEDSVVEQEIAVLQKMGYPVFTYFFSNDAYKKLGWRTLLAPSRLFFNMTAFLKTYWLVKKNKIRFVHVHNFYYTASPSVFWAAKAAGAYTLFSVHNYRLFCLNGFFFRDGATCMLCHEQKSLQPGITYSCFKSSAVFSSMLASSINFHRQRGTWQHKVDRFVVLNPLIRQLLIESGIPDKKIYMKSNFLNQNLSCAYSNYDERKDYYLFVGRVSEEKGIRHLIQAFKKNGKKLKLVGSGPLAEWLKEQVDANIAYQPAIAREELFTLYASCKALVFSSLWPEGQPMTIIEAQSTGALIIAAASAITKQMIGDQYGLLYTQGQADELNRMISIFESIPNDKLKAMSVRAHEYFLQNYTETQQLRAVSELYDDALAQ
ncbi:MAG: glycosyltransferase family 4 protein [Sediminibacterium sp.]